MAKKKVKAETWWTIKSPCGVLIVCHTSLFRADAIRSFIANDIFNTTWKKEMKDGYRAVKIKVQEVK